MCYKKLKPFGYYIKKMKQDLDTGETQRKKFFRAVIALC